MKTTRYLILTVLMACIAQGVELQALQHQVLHDERTFARDSADRRYSLWTDEPVKVAGLLKEFGFSNPDFKMEAGQVLAVFLNDTITEDLTQMTYNKTANRTFADYADSGIRFKLKAPEEGKKYSHVTVVVFTPVGTPSHLGLRGMIAEGLSEKR